MHASFVISLNLKELVKTHFLQSTEPNKFVLRVRLNRIKNSKVKQRQEGESLMDWIRHLILNRQFIFYCISIYNIHRLWIHGREYLILRIDVGTISHIQHSLMVINTVFNVHISGMSIRPFLTVLRFWMSRMRWYWKCYLKKFEDKAMSVYKIIHIMLNLVDGCHNGNIITHYYFLMIFFSDRKIIDRSDVILI